MAGAKIEGYKPTSQFMKTQTKVIEGSLSIADTIAHTLVRHTEAVYARTCAQAHGGELRLSCGQPLDTSSRLVSTRQGALVGNSAAGGSAADGCGVAPDCRFPQR